MNNINTPENLIFEIEKQEEVLRNIIELESHPGFIALMETVKDKIESLSIDFCNINKTDSELRYISGYLTGLYVFDTFKVQKINEIAMKKETLKTYEYRID